MGNPAGSVGTADENQEDKTIDTGADTTTQTDGDAGDDDDDNGEGGENDGETALGADA